MHRPWDEATAASIIWLILVHASANVVSRASHGLLLHIIIIITATATATAHVHSPTSLVRLLLISLVVLVTVPLGSVVQLDSPAHDWLALHLFQGLLGFILHGELDESVPL